jgi:hypothetical protein
VLPKWEVPADIDQAMPPAVTEIPCPLPQLLHGVSERVEELVSNLLQFSARERIEHVEIGRNGNPHRARKTNFTYVAQINQSASGSPSVEEYRTSEAADENIHGQLVDTGTAAFALTWQLHFAQRPNRGNFFHVYRVGVTYYPVLKGRAWIAADNYEVLRLETYLLEPIAQIRLQREHSDIQYGPVEFPKQNVRLWLPQIAELYMDYRGHRYQRRHTFSNFQLFRVETGGEIKWPKAGQKK